MTLKKIHVQIYRRFKLRSPLSIFSLTHPRTLSLQFSHRQKFPIEFKCFEREKKKRRMFEPQHFVDLQDNSAFGDSKSSWLTGDGNSSPTQRGAAQPSLGNSGATNSNVDRDLYKDLVEIVPLVQSLIVCIFLFFLT